MDNDPRPNTDRLADALGFATRYHRGQVRKGTATPLCESPPARGRVRDGRRRGRGRGDRRDPSHAAEVKVGKQFSRRSHHAGSQVARIVEECSDSLSQSPQNKDPWLAETSRRGASLDAPRLTLIIAADKLHNVQPTRDDLRQGKRKSGTL